MSRTDDPDRGSEECCGCGYQLLIFVVGLILGFAIVSGYAAGKRDARDLNMEAFMR